MSKKDEVKEVAAHPEVKPIPALSAQSKPGDVAIYMEQRVRVIERIKGGFVVSLSDGSSKPVKI